MILTKLYILQAFFKKKENILFLILIRINLIWIIIKIDVYSATAKSVRKKNVTFV